MCQLKNASWSSRPNPSDQINRKPDDRKNDQRTKKVKKTKDQKYCFEPNIQLQLHSVNFDVLIC